MFLNVQEYDIYELLSYKNYKYNWNKLKEYIQKDYNFFGKLIAPEYGCAMGALNRVKDKMNLVKVRQISLNYQNNKQIIANYIPDFYPNSGEYYEFLGVYKTKERALEVLNEIQDKMLNGAFAKKINGLGEELDLIPNQILIYNMPKD